METANSIVNDALQEILVQANEAPIQTVDFNQAVRYMNRMMASLDARGISLGYTTVSKASDPITVPDGAIDGIVFNLAIRLATSFDMPIGAGLAQSARDGLAAMRRLTVRTLPTPMPCTMPIGSGNEGETTFITDHFYDCPEDQVLTEGDGFVTLEEATNASE